MSIRWVFSPVVNVTMTDPESGDSHVERLPKAVTLIEPGRGKPYQGSSVQGFIGGTEWALSFIRADDFSTINLDADCRSPLELDYEDIDSLLSKTPRELGWNQTRTNRLIAFLSSRGVDTTGLNRDTPIAVYLRRLGRALRTDFEPLHTGARPI